jgi:hypothetical protein
MIHSHHGYHKEGDGFLNMSGSQILQDGTAVLVNSELVRMRKEVVVTQHKTGLLIRHCLQGLRKIIEHLRVDMPSMRC